MLSYSQAEKLSRARKKYLATTYKDFFSALYILPTSSFEYILLQNRGLVIVNQNQWINEAVLTASSLKNNGVRTKGFERGKSAAPLYCAWFGVVLLLRHEPL